MFNRVWNLAPLTALRGPRRLVAADRDQQPPLPDRKPESIQKVGSLRELGTSLDNPDTDAAYFEVPEVPNQELFIKHIGALLSSVFEDVKLKLTNVSASKTSRIRSIIKGAKNGLNLPKDSPTRTELETLIDQIADDISITLSHFKGQRISLFTAKGSAGDGQAAGYFHVDSYESGTSKVIRTYVGPSTEFALNLNGNGAVSPKNGAITVHRLNTIHRAAILKRGEIRFAIAVSLYKPKKYA